MKISLKKAAAQLIIICLFLSYTAYIISAKNTSANNFDVQIKASDNIALGSTGINVTITNNCDFDVYYYTEEIEVYKTAPQYGHADDNRPIRWESFRPVNDNSIGKAKPKTVKARSTVKETLPLNNRNMLLNEGRYRIIYNFVHDGYITSSASVFNIIQNNNFDKSPKSADYIFKTDENTYKIKNSEAEVFISVKNTFPFAVTYYEGITLEKKNGNIWENYTDNVFNDYSVVLNPTVLDYNDTYCDTVYLSKFNSAGIKEGTYRLSMNIELTVNGKKQYMNIRSNEFDLIK